MKRLLFLFSIAILAFPLFWSCSEKEIPVASVTLSQPAAEMFIGESITLKAIISPSDATVIEVIWASSKQSVASVDQSGKVVAIAEGTSTITATVGGKMGSCVVTVSKKFVDVSSINLDKTSASLKVGEKVTLTATVKPDDATDKTVTWSTSDASVATVDNGVVTAIKLGSATITTKAGDKKATCAITVEATPVTSITLDKTSASLKVGEKVTLTATVKPDDATDKTVTWSTSDASVATVEGGVVTAKKLGTATITAKAGDKKATCAITVEATPVTSVTLDKTNASLKVGEKVTLTATVKPDDATDKTVTWSTSDASVAEVNNGEVRAKKLGTATITAKAGDKKATCAITVEATPVTSITLDKTSVTLKVGEKVSLTATVKPNDATDKTVTWNTSDASVAEVNNGEVRAKKIGTATITAKAGDKKATCTITVEATPVTSITLDKTSASLKVGETVTFVATVKPDDATDKMVTWSTSDASVATVDQNGKVTALSKGKTTIMSIAHDGSGYSASCSVIVSSPCPIGAVDLGMTTSEGYNLYWATCNVCETGFVSSPEEVGDYYAWGEVEPYYSSQDPLTWKDGKTGYIWDSYKWCNGSVESLTKYNTSAWRGTVDNKTVLEAEDDVVHVKLGGSWRMPTVAEWTELRENCTWTWTTQNGVNGRLVTSNKNGNSIFLPAAGTRVGPVLNGAGSNGYYWSSSLFTDAPDSALDVNFNSSYVSWSNAIRCAGRSVRPVCE